MSIKKASSGSPSTRPSSTTPSKSKKRCWAFHVKKRCWTLRVAGVTSSVKEVDVQESFRKRYTSVRKVVFMPTSDSDCNTGDGQNGGSKSVCVEVLFTGPQPIGGPADLMCELLSGTSVEAQPVHLGRGRKKKNRINPASTETRAADVAGGVDVGTAGCAPEINLTDDRGAHNLDRSIQERAIEESVHDITSQTIDINVDDLDTPGLTLQDSIDDALFAPRVGIECPEPNSPHIHPLNDDLPPQRGSGGVHHNTVSNSSQALSAREFFADACSTIMLCEDSEATASQPRRISTTTDSEDSARVPGLPDVAPSDIPLRQTEPCLGRSWSLDSTHMMDISIGAGDIGTGASTAVLHEEQSAMGLILEEKVCDAAPCSTSADAVGGADQREEEEAGLQKPSEDISPKPEVSFGWFRQECDFEGRSAPAADVIKEPPAAEFVPSDRCHLAFTGLESAGRDVLELNAFVNFWVNPEEKVLMRASALEVDVNGYARATATYPAMKEIWPEAYGMVSILVVEVNMAVELRSRDGEYQCTGPELKVTYRRTAGPVALGAR